MLRAKQGGAAEGMVRLRRGWGKIGENAWEWKGGVVRIELRGVIIYIVLAITFLHRTRAKLVSHFADRDHYTTLAIRHLRPFPESPYPVIFI